MILEIEKYAEIVRTMPIVCVDGIIKKGHNYLLLRRKNEPLLGEWWIPGGRIHRGELPENAITRKMYEETGLKVEIVKCVGYYSEYYPTSPFNASVHTISLVYLLKPLTDQIVLDWQSADFKWAESLPSTLQIKFFDKLWPQKKRSSQEQLVKTLAT